ncbi:MAG: M48 family metalloprotease [Rhizobiaceae bacterium]|nr:M48 family metalloprotease [Rhizobiaceae bacterium]
MFQRKQFSGVALFRLCQLFVVASLVSACIPTNTDNSGSFTSSWVRPEDPQEQIGAREHPLVVAKYGGEYQYLKAERMLALIVGELVAVSDDPTRVYRVTMLNSPKVNAFALPGGYLYITRGLLALANDSAEIAAVIAHEMAHVSANHAILRREKQVSTELGERVATEVLGDSTSARVALAANQLKLSDFSREQELQADALGIRMTGKAGYDAFAGARFLETLSAFRTINRNGLAAFDDSSFLSTHPSTPRRTELAKRHARFFGAPGIGRIDRDRFLQGIEGMVFGDSAEEGFVRAQRFSHSGLGITFAAPTGYRIENQTKAVVITGKDGVAIRFDATVIDKSSNLKDYMNSGWVNGLESASIEVNTINGLKTASGNARADSWNFRIHVIRIGTQLYRFIAAVSQADGTGAVSVNTKPTEENSQRIANLKKVVLSITDSFRKLSARELENLAPLKIRIVTFKDGDSLASLANQMKSGGNTLKLFRILNGLGPGEMPKAGYKLKIVSD